MRDRTSSLPNTPRSPIHGHRSPIQTPNSPIHSPDSPISSHALIRHQSMVLGHRDIITSMTSSPVPFARTPAKSAEEAGDAAVPALRLDAETEEELHTQAPDFIKSSGLSTEEANELLAEYGRNELAEKITPKWLVFARLLIQPMPCMIWLAIVVEAGIQNWLDMGILLGIQFTNASIAFYESNKAGNAVAALKASLQARATVKRDGKWSVIEAALCVPGDLVLLAAGSAVPADCRVNSGQIDVDQAALTGESLPVTLFESDSAKMGSTVVLGEVEGTIEFTGKNTFFGKTASLLEDNHEITNLQRVLMTIVIILMIVSLLLAGIVFAYLLASGEDIQSTLSFTVVLLVASIPIAIEIVVTTTLALGSKELAKHGAIVTRLAAIEDLAGMNILCSDKTGTLTLNKMVIQEQTPVYREGVTQTNLLRMAAMAAKWMEPPRDALDTMVLGQADLSSLSNVSQLDYMPFNPIQKRTEGTVEETLSSGEVQKYKISKGAPHVIAELCEGDDEAVSRCEHDVQGLGERGIRSLAVAKTDELGSWKLQGLLTFLDPPRPDTKQTISEAGHYGVKVKMITGDHLLIAKEMARQLDLGTDIESSKDLPLLDEHGKKPARLGEEFGPAILKCDGFAQVFPEHKYLIVEALRELKYKVGMTGDGVNDAPALKRADVGVAVCGSTDAARAAADIVLTQPGLSTIIHGIVISRCIFARMRSFLTYRIAATLQLLCFFFVAVLALHPTDFEPNDPKPSGYGNQAAWPSFFHLPVVMLMLITLLNDGTLITIGYDHVVPNQNPDKWNLRLVFTMASLLAAIPLISSLLLLWGALDSWSSGSAFEQLGISGVSYAEISSIMYLKISISDFLTLFSSRSYGQFFFFSRPSPLLLGGAVFALSVSTIIANVWARSTTDGVEVVGLAYDRPHDLSVFVWIYSLVWWLVQDAAKVGLYRLLQKHNMFNMNQTLQMGKLSTVSPKPSTVPPSITPPSGPSLSPPVRINVQAEHNPPQPANEKTKELMEGML